MLAGLPRIVRAADEVHWRGEMLLSLGIASAVYWTVLWLVDGPVKPLVAALVALVALLMALVLGGITSRRRFAYAMDNVRNPRGTVHETPADGRERHVRASVVIVLGVVVLLVFDTLISDVGGVAALLAGACVGLGVVDLREARRWTQAEDDRSSRIFLMLRPAALLARMGASEVYELPRAAVPDDGPSPFDLP